MPRGGHAAYRPCIVQTGQATETFTSMLPRVALE
jgi:hypothetical protein